MSLAGHSLLQASQAHEAGDNQRAAFLAELVSQQNSLAAHLHLAASAAQALGETMSQLGLEQLPHDEVLRDMQRTDQLAALQEQVAARCGPPDTTTPGADTDTTPTTPGS